MAKRKQTKTKTTGGAEPPASGQPNHDERMLDESIEESFPASDPATSSRPGSTLGRRYATTRKKRRG